MTRIEIAARAESLLPEALGTASSRFATICDMAVTETLDAAGLDADVADIPARVGDVAVELAVWRWGLIGSESVASEGYSGVSQQLMQDIPPRIRQKLRAIRRVKWG